MKYVFNYCKQKNIISGDLSKFKQFVHDLWFKLYRRDTKGDSSAFEHVFVGEERRGKLMGMHNWIRLYSEEKKGRIIKREKDKTNGRESREIEKE